MLFPEENVLFRELAKKLKGLPKGFFT